MDLQELPPFEHYIIDGSTTKEIIDWLVSRPQPSYRKWIHERDTGIADAFNKGIGSSSGDILCLLNAGDELYNATVVGKVTEVFSKERFTMWCHGKMMRHRGGIWAIAGNAFDKNKMHQGMRTVFHPTMYVRRQVYDRTGLYNTSLTIAMDYDFLCRIADEPFYFIDYPLAKYDPTGISSSNFVKAIQESNQQYKKYFGVSLKQRFWFWWQLILSWLLTNEAGRWLYRAKMKLRRDY